MNAVQDAQVKSIEQTQRLASRLAQLVSQSNEQLTIHLMGELGAGKTAFARALIQSLGYEGAVRSPSYNIVQSYDLLSEALEKTRSIYHFDLYRLNDPEELDALGFRDYFSEGSICLLEWPQKGQGVLPEPDIRIEISLPISSQEQTTRNFCFTPVSESGHKILSKLEYTLL